MKPPWSRWSTLSAGLGFVARDSAREPLISLGGSRTCARCRGDTASRSSNWPGSIPAASTFNNNFIILLHDRPPKSQERPNGRVRGRALLPWGKATATLIRYDARVLLRLPHLSRFRIFGREASEGPLRTVHAELAQLSRDWACGRDLPSATMRVSAQPLSAAS